MREESSKTQHLETIFFVIVGFKEMEKTSLDLTLDTTRIIGSSIMSALDFLFVFMLVWNRLSFCILVWPKKLLCNPGWSQIHDNFFLSANENPRAITGSTTGESGGEFVEDKGVQVMMEEPTKRVTHGRPQEGEIIEISRLYWEAGKRKEM